MKPFSLESGMLTLGGVFYPTGYMVVMFPGKDDALKASQALLDKGYDADAISLLTPEIIHEQITRTVGNADAPLPSAGTEGDTVRRFAELASQGHHGLMVHAPKAEESEHAMEVLKGANISYAQKYRHLVIEDLV